MIDRCQIYPEFGLTEYSLSPSRPIGSSDPLLPLTGRNATPDGGR